MNAVEYLLRYGLAGDFGRFRPVGPLTCRRGDRAVVRSQRGLEIGQVLREATPRHATFLPNTSVGQLLRLCSPEDEQTAARMQERGQQLFERGGYLARELGLPLELLDVEVLLDGHHAVLHHLRWEECDVRPFVSTLAREYEVTITLDDLTRPQDASAPNEEEHHGCGQEGCGRGGGCGSCGSGGGCGTCGSAEPQDVQAYFAGLRARMERRTPLL